MVFNSVQQPAEEVHLFSDTASGLDAAMVLHSTVLGPAAGGCRFWTSDERDTMTQAVADTTWHVAGLPSRQGRPGGDPSPGTARGVSMQLAVERHLGRPLLECTVAIQGVGNVGRKLALKLHGAGPSCRSPT